MSGNILLIQIMMVGKKERQRRNL